MRAALDARNDGMARFWLKDRAGAAPRTGPPAGRSVLVVDAEDTFTEMIAHQIRSLGCETVVRRFDEPYDVHGYDLVVMGPGPGDPRQAAHPKIAHLRSGLVRLLRERRPFLAVCLSHQVLSTLLDLPLRRRELPNQGARHTIDLFGLFGGRARVGFYNTYAARWGADSFTHPLCGPVEVSRDAATDEVHALRAGRFASVQFHAESVLTEDGPDILGALLRHVSGPPPAAHVPVREPYGSLLPRP